MQRKPGTGGKTGMDNVNYDPVEVRLDAFAGEIVTGRASDKGTPERISG